MSLCGLFITVCPWSCSAKTRNNGSTHPEHLLRKPNHLLKPYLDELMDAPRRFANRQLGEVLMGRSVFNLFQMTIYLAAGSCPCYNYNPCGRDRPCERPPAQIRT